MYNLSSQQEGNDYMTDDDQIHSQHHFHQGPIQHTAAPGTNHSQNFYPSQSSIQSSQGDNQTESSQESYESQELQPSQEDKIPIYHQRKVKSMKHNQYNYSSQGSKQNSQQYTSFPTMSVSEMLSCFHEMSLNMTKEQFDNPTKEVSNKIYWYFLKVIWGVDSEYMYNMIKQLPNNKRSQLTFIKNANKTVPNHLKATKSSFAHHHGHSSQESTEYASFKRDGKTMPPHEDNNLIFMLFFYHCQFLLTAAGIDNFTIGDLIRPSKDRLYYHCCGLINLVKFKASEVEKIQHLEDSKSSLLAKLSELESQEQQIKQERDLFRAQASEERPRIESLENQKQTLHQEQIRIDHTIRDLHQTIEKKKDLIPTLEEQNKNYEQKLENLKKDIAMHQNDIIRDPNTLKKSINSNKILSKSNQQRLSELNRLKSIKSTELSKIKEAIQQLRECIEKMNTIKSQQERVERSKSELERLKHDIQASKDTKERLSSSIKSINHELRMMHTEKENYDSVMSNFNSKKETIARESDARRVSKTQELESLQSKVTMLQNRIQDVQQAQTNLRQMHKEHMHKLVGEFKSTFDVVTDYHTQVVSDFQLA